MNGERIISACVLAVLILAPLVALPFPGESMELHLGTDLSRSYASFWGEDTGDYSGYSVAGAGDVNGDGYDDILIGAYGDDDGGASAGQVYLVLGRLSGLLMDTDLSAASASFIGEDAGDYFGRCVAGAGDVNGDGYDDFLIGAENDDDGGSSAGQTYLILGKASGWSMGVAPSSISFIGEGANDYSGHSVAGAGDVNGDGYDDILIGAYGDDDGGASAGQTYLIFGKSAGLGFDNSLSTADASFIGEDAGDSSGYSVAGAGDVNGDGYDDILIGAYGDDDGGADAGQTYLILGKASGWAMDTDLSAATASFWGENGNDLSGYSVAGAGDVNADGYDDIIVGAYGDDDGGSAAGQTYLILGKVSGWAMDTDLSAATASFRGEDAGDSSGYSVAGADDVNGDGYDDILIGAYGDDDGGSMAGQTYLIPGGTSGWAMDTDLSAAGASFMGEDGGDYSGISVAGAGDVNGDGYDDILIGAYGEDDGGSMAGQSYLFLPYADPPAPGNLKASITGTGVTLYWKLPSWNEPVTGYRVYRSMDGSGNVHVATLGAPALSYTDLDVVEGRTYTYSVVAVYENGESSGLTALVSIDYETPSHAMMPGIGMRTDLSWAQASFWGEDASDNSGVCVAGAGDVNGDGYDDMLVGALYDDDGGSNAGQTYLILGKASGWATDADLSAASASFWGEDALDLSGLSVAGAGDVNGDGYDDILIGAYADDDGGIDAGQTYLIFGKASGWAMDTDLSAASASFIGEDAGDNAGWQVAGAGDVNKDGYDDILIGAYGDDDGGSNAGQTYLILGKASGWAMDTDLSSASASFWGEDADDMSGFSVAGAGDVNGDAYDDILIGAYGDEDGGSYAGQTYLVLGKPSGWAMDTDLLMASASFWGEDSGDWSGYSVDGAGDVNGDRCDDILIGARYDDCGAPYAGQVYLILGKRSGWARDTSLSAASASFIGEEGYDDAGLSVAGAGDVDEDGYADFLIGALRNDFSRSNAGQTYLILGKASGWMMGTDLSAASGSFCGENSGDISGRSVAGAGDVNGDGRDDILIGAPLNSEGGAQAGQTYLVVPDAGPPAPKNLKAALAQNQPQITLTWDAADSWSAPLEFYRFYRSTDGVNYDYLTLRIPSDRTYVDSNVSYGRTYSYKVATDYGKEMLSHGSSMVSLVCDRDTDLDGIGDLADWDDDGDGVVDGSDAFPLNSAETLDTDLDGTGNNADTDDDNDGILDTSDPEPRNPQNALQYHLNYLNTTLQGVQTTVNGFSSTLNTMNTNLNTLSSTVSSMQTSMTNLINNIDSDIATLSTQVRGDIATMNSQVRADIAGVNSTVRADITNVRTGLNAMNASLQSNLDNVRTLVNEVSSDLSAMDAEMKGMNRSLSQDMTDMEARLAMDIEALGVALEAVNASLQAELAALDGELADFRMDMAAELNALRASMDGANRTQTENYRKLENLMNGINTTTLADIKGAIAELDAETTQMGVNLNGRIDEFRTTAMGRLENISKLMATVDDIKSLTTEVKGVQGGVNAVKTEQETTSKNVAALAPPSWLGVVLIIIVLLLAAVILMRGGKKEATPAPASPPGPKPLEPMPPPED